MTIASVAALRTYVLENAGAASHELASFVPAYFDSADPDEVQARGPATLMAIANAHLRLLDLPRNANGARIRVFNPTLAEDGFVSEHTIIQIVHDDMPFLVDSVTMAVNRSGRIAHWIVHPLLIVERDDQNRISQTLLAKSQGTQTSQIESFILVECDRIAHESERNAMAAELARVLGDVLSLIHI